LKNCGAAWALTTNELTARAVAAIRRKSIPVASSLA
jgi:hypothetical protein